MEFGILQHWKMKSQRIQKVELIGIYGEALYEKVNVALRYLASQNKDFKYTAECLLPLPFEIRASSIKKDLKYVDSNLLTLRRLTSPIIIINGNEFMKSPAEFFERVFVQYQYKDRTPLVLYHRLGLIKLTKFLNATGRIYAYIDFKIDHPKHPNPYRVIFELFNDIVPKTVKNFAELIQGTHKNASGKVMTYKDTKIHRIQPNGFIQGGDIEHKDGAGGESIYGKYFEDENYAVPHDKPGIIGMANKGMKHTNNSQFYVTLCKVDYFNKSCVAFGTVVTGYRVIKLINSIPVENGKPLVNVTIGDCGIHVFRIPKYKKSKK